MCFVIDIHPTKDHSRECRDPPRSKAKTAAENRKKMARYTNFYFYTPL